MAARTGLNPPITGCAHAASSSLDQVPHSTVSGPHAYYYIYPTSAKQSLSSVFMRGVASTSSLPSRIVAARSRVASSH